MNSFIPRNQLEHDLLAAQEGRISGEDFMQKLLGAQLYMPILDESTHGISNLQTSQTAKPLSVQNELEDDYLVLFTSPERAVDFIKEFPGYEGGLLTDLGWIFDKMGIGFGITLNPDWPVGMDLEPEMVRQLAASGETS